MQNNNNFKSNIEDEEINTNTHGICIWKDISECSNCNINNKLHCHVHIKYSIYFGVGFLAALIPALIGIFFSGFETSLLFIILIGWIIYALFFFCI